MARLLQTWLTRTPELRRLTVVSLALAAMLAASISDLSQCVAIGPAHAEYCPPHLRAPGYQPTVWKWAEPQRAWNYTGYYVGGGAPTWKGCPRPARQGTWGWDYSGSILQRRVQLGWWNKWQGGAGQYEPDGPRPIHELHARHEE